MYKLLLCWRYLRTRYLAMVCIVSVMLGVATLIVVNSVMGGFSTKLRDRLHGLLSDVMIESYDYNGFANPEQKMELIRSDPLLNEAIEAMAPTLEIFAMIQFTYQDRQVPVARPIRLIGIDVESRSRVGGFAEFLLLNKNKASFELTPEAKRRHQENNRLRPRLEVETPVPAPGDDKPPPEPPPSREFVPENAIVGYAIAHQRYKGGETGEAQELCLIHPGDDIVITTISGQKLSPVYSRFTLCDYFRSDMSEYDSNYVFVPLKYLQHLRTMEDRVTSIQIRLKDERDMKAVVNRLNQLFGGTLRVQTWQDKQGPLLAAISIEKGILNILLFLIIAVAGFGILAIFSMIVVEKTRDIGIMKALGASNGGILKIFLGYGLLLGVVGAVLGTFLGLTITSYINEIEFVLSKITGQEIFPRDIYYFDRIPTDIQPLHVAIINAGAVAIAVLFSVLPALRAALLHPVRALRYE